MATTILLVDDHQVLLDGLRLGLDQRPDMDVIGEAGDGETAVRLARQLRPDVVIMDISMAGMTGVDATRRIAGDCPDTKIIALSMHAKAIFIAETLKAGASGYISKQNGFSSMVRGIETVLAGDCFLCPRAAGLLAREYVRSSGNSRLATLTEQEREILKFLADGKSSKAIGLLMGLTTKSIDYHRRRIMEKLNVSSIAGLVKTAVREGLTPLEV
jgi:DNA-binding NarL/FixJ family response regulator